MVKLIKNGRIVTSTSEFDGDILIIDGKISAVGSNLEEAIRNKCLDKENREFSSLNAKSDNNTNLNSCEHASSNYCNDLEIIDATGLMVLPGAIDAHTHFELQSKDYISADTYESGSKAGAAGGVTTFIDYTLQNKGESILSMIKERDELCKGKSYIDYSFHGGIQDVDSNTLANMKECIEFGIPSFKIYMVYDFGINLEQIKVLLKLAKEVGALITVHCEDSSLVNENIARLRKENNLSPWDHYVSRNEEVERKAIEELVALAREIDVPIYIVHISSKEGIKIIEEAKKREQEKFIKNKACLGEKESKESCDSKEIEQKIFAETCPHYLEFTNEVFKREDGNRFICSPPMKGKESKDYLNSILDSDIIDVIATDHCPFMSYEKDANKEDFTKMANGVMGIENIYPYMLDKANSGELSFSRVVKLCSTNPAKIFGLASRKGDIKVGLDADLVLYDRTKKLTISKENQQSKVDYNIYEGKVLSGLPVLTMVRGEAVYKNGQIVGNKGYGKFIHRSN